MYLLIILTINKNSIINLIQPIYLIIRCYNFHKMKNKIHQPQIYKNTKTHHHHYLLFNNFNYVITKMQSVKIYSQILWIHGILTITQIKIMMIIIPPKINKISHNLSILMINQQLTPNYLTSNKFSNSEIIILCKKMNLV